MPLSTEDGKPKIEGRANKLSHPHHDITKPNLTLLNSDRHNRTKPDTTYPTTFIRPKPTRASLEESSRVSVRERSYRDVAGLTAKRGKLDKAFLVHP